ncbi:uncharacterized protein KGF55_002741 [Candida pseudojiufengensis]|uniref:uncharacterized protein n=1 Tax=Candida pseudojiufengensis TaxID=497109 RepID=UPI0022243185|nr:uncharacterized protein KGF55_002741 [Candida pseudojiufengensis]KAI5962949.1 hypothetical protein KGF55_002741 [Candida pseudojiufengensis]
MSDVESLGIDVHVISYFLRHGFRQYLIYFQQDLKEGSSLISIGSHDPAFVNSSLSQVIQQLNNVGLIINSDTGENHLTLMLDRWVINATVKKIGSILTGENINSFEFPNVQTADLIAKVLRNKELESDTPEWDRVYFKVFRMFNLILEKYPELQLINNSPNLNIALYCSNYIDRIAGLINGDFHDSFVAVSKILRNGYEGEIPLLSFVKNFNSTFLTTIQSLISGSHNKEKILNSQKFNELREKGNNLMSFQSFGQAIKVYTEALTVTPENYTEEDAQILTNRAIAFIGLNCVPEAIDDLNAAILVNKAFTPAWTQLGYCHLYMGSGLMALQCYLIALKCATGYILPPKFPSHDTKTADEYREVTQQTVLPQFIERLSAAIALTEKRAYQQRVNELKIKTIVSEVRKILAHLRANCPEGDRDYFTYLPVYRDSTLRNLSERANASRPNILTPEVSQNMLARNGMETATITQIDTIPHTNDAPRATTATTTVDVTANTNTENESRTNVVTGTDGNGNPIDDIREFINRYAFDNRGNEGTSSNNNNSTNIGPNRTSQDETGGSNNSRTTETQQNPNPNPNQRQNLPNEPTNITSMIPEAILQGLGNVLGPTFSNTFDRIRNSGGGSTTAVFVNGVDVSQNPNQNANQNINHNRSQSQNQPSGAQTNPSTTQPSTNLETTSNQNHSDHETTNNQSQSDQDVDIQDLD